MTQDIVILDGARTAIGTLGGALSETPASDLGAHAIREAVKRAGLQPEQIDQVILGCVGQVAEDGYIARHASIKAGMPIGTPAYTVNRICGSGLEAINTAARWIQTGDAEIVVAGGAENMSRAPYVSLATRFGARMGDSKMIDMMTGALHDPFHSIHMGVTAENIAAKWGITREDQDALAVESHNRAQRAIEGGRFKEQIVPVMLKSRKGEVAFDTDEHFRPNCTLADMAKLKPVFIKENGTVTAGNASGINDAAAALVLMEAGTAKARGIQPLARLVAYAHAGVDPQYMGIGPVPATQLALKKAGLTVNDLDVIEANEAFAAQACAVTRDLGLDPAKVNPNGSGISLGHPIGATGALITVKALHELQRIQGRYALVTMCIGGGQGIAAIFERM